MSNTEFYKVDILSNPSLPVVYTQIRGLAQELAVLGRIETASQIIDLLLSHHGTDHELKQVQFLKFAFEQTGYWPDAIPKSARSSKALDELETPKSDSMDEAEFNDLIERTELAQRDPARCLAIAVHLCEEADQTDANKIKRDERVVEALKQFTEYSNDYIAAIIQYRNIWPLLASGILAQHLGVDDEKLSSTAEEIIETIGTRFEKGRQKGDQEGKPIKELLDKLVENTKKYAGSLYEELGQNPPESYFYEPATERQIQDMERRLKIPSLPDDYREFLLASNGLEPVYNGESMTLPLFSTSDVVLSGHPDIIKVPLDLFEECTGTNEFIRQAGGFDEWPKVTRQIEIGRSNEPVYLLTAPSDVKATVEAYKAALANDKVSDAMKAETIHAIEDLYGSIEAFENLEWAMKYDINFEPTIPVGTFRTWLEQAVRKSGIKEYSNDSSKSSLAYACKTIQV